MGFEPFRSQCSYTLKQALCAPYSDNKSWEHWYFKEVPDSPQIQTTNIIWVQKGAQIKLIRDIPFPDPSICLSKVLENKLTPGSPVGALMERVAHFQSLLQHVSLVPHKSSPDKRSFTLLSKALGKEHPPMFPKMSQNEALMETDTHFQSLTS